FFDNVNIGPAGAWIGGAGDRFFVAGDLVGRALLPDNWQTANAELHFTGGIRHLLSVMGNDLGITFDGYENNFAWGILSLDPADHLTLDGQGALYVHQLQLTSIDQLSGSQNIYYDLRYPANAYLNGQTYALAGGGQIAPVPEPAAIVFAILPTLLIAGR